MINTQKEIEADMLTWDEYQALAQQLDELWNKPTTAGDRLEIERLLRLIEPSDAIALKCLGKR
ncbi:hypothetical protein [Undibacterium terreum]|uniref:Uncharacterized protein n=1 Tax=Undibacterium terreum TaxID=1224302 RepID=A0A916U3F6_9BURK|nr:hypothetical protein [Undibacterium terreum]GGC58111.1 hypothetical protein GCM10011396_01140 [Undibacterium terreum]